MFLLYYFCHFNYNYCIYNYLIFKIDKNVKLRLNIRKIKFKLRIKINTN